MNESEDADSLSLFHSLPNEILVKILKNISTFDLLQFCNAYPKFKYVFEERKVLRTVNLSRGTGFRNKIYPFLETIRQFRSDYIIIFNINNVYWVPAEDIRRCLKTLSNVEEIHVLGTKISLGPSDYKSFHVAKLKKLAIPFQSKDTRLSKLSFPELKSFCLQITSKDYKRDHISFQSELENLISKLHNLEELWIYDVTESDPIHCDQIIFRCENLKIFAFKANSLIFPPSAVLKFTKIFSNNRLIGIESYYVKDCLKDSFLVSDPNTPAWINYFHASTPYGLYDAKEFQEKVVNIHNIFFKELNLAHTTSICSIGYRLAMRDLLCSKNVSRIRKISFNNCAFENIIIYPDSKENLKRLKLDNMDILSEHQKSIVENLGKLEELEIFACSRCYEFGICYQIKNFKFLKKLTLEVPAHVNGEFIKHVMQNCDELESLKVNVIASNESFNRNFQRYISMAKNLRELRFEHYRISLESLFYGLAEIKGSRMEKLYIKCKTVDNYGKIYLKKFFERNPNMEFALIIINTATGNMLKELSEQMKNYKNSSEKIFLAKKDANILNCSFLVPDCFKFELTSPQSHVAALNIYEDFFHS